MRRKLAACALSLAVGIAVPSMTALGASSQAWVLRNRSDFVKADLGGVSLSPDGALRLSAQVMPILDTAQPSVWCLARDAQGYIYAGSGNEGKVFRISPDGKSSEVVFDAAELQVHALAFDKQGRLHAATSPRGAVHRIGSDGRSEVVFDPEEIYIWAIAFDERGRLHVATGQRGRVFRVDSPGPGASGVVELDGREDHIRTLAAGPGGVLYAGTDQSGIVYALPTDGPPGVVYDTPMREVSAIAVVGDTIYVAALAPMSRPRGGGQPPPGAGVTRVTVTADEGGPPEGPGPERSAEEQPDQGQPRPAQRPQPAAESYYGAVFRIAPSGYARRIWESREALPLSLAPYPDRDGAPQAGRVLVGTGNDGRILLLDDAGEATDYVEIGSAQVNALLPAATGRNGAGLYAAASNLGQVAWIGAAGAQTGTVTSAVLDGGFTSSWGMIAWEGEMPAGSSTVIAVRTGNTEEPDASWSEWSRDYDQPAGSLIERPRARYLQWRATLKAGRAAGPTLRSVQINYLQDNLPPEVADIEVQLPGVTLMGGGGVSDSPDAAGGRRAPAQPRRGFERGRRAAAWKAEDVNDDEIRYELYFKAEDETLWKPLAKELADPFHTWDATALPDGVYRLKVTATDAPSNPEGAALVGSQISEAFDVDNTPPQVAPPQARITGRVAEVTVEVTDSFSVVGETAWSLDAADWIVLLPVDRIADSRKETYRFRTPELQPGEHTITVRSQDRAENAAASKVVIEVKP